MAPTFACVFALLVSQVTVVSAASSPFTDPANANTLACAAYDAGCTCAGVGLVDNTSVPVTENCSGWEATFSKCSSKCCGDPAVATCGSVLTNDVIVGGLCGATMEADYAKLLNAAGATTVLQKANCCKAKVTATCAAVKCNVAVTSMTDHGPMAVIYQAKAGVALTLACNSNRDCEMKCCEKNPMTCEGNKEMANSWRNTMCGVNYTDKARWAAGVHPNCGTQTMTAAYSATFTDNATFKTACCNVVPPVVAVVKAKCAATPVCPTHYQARSPVPTTDCMGATCTRDECCQMKSDVSHCYNNCTAMTTKSFQTAIANSCDMTMTTYCTSVRCAAGLVLAVDSSKLIANATTATDTVFSAACCIAGPPATPAAPPPAKCAAFFAAAAAGKAKAEGSVSAAYMQGGSLSILAVAVLMAMKVGV